MKRELTSHKVNELNEALRIEVLDLPGAGNACHRYKIVPPWKNPVEKYPAENSTMMRAACDINFQNGPIAESGVNGISNEALLAIVEDRLLGFQSGTFACRENALALTKVQEAMMWLHKRTRDRMAVASKAR